MRERLGDACAGVYDEMEKDSPLAPVLAARDAARDAGADLVIAVGGGSVIQATRVVVMLLAGTLGRMFSPVRIMAVSACAMGLLVLLIVNIPVLVVVLALLAVVGLPVVAFVVSEATLLQSGVADQLRGRVMGSYGMAQALAMLLGMGVASALADRVGVAGVGGPGAGAGGSAGPLSR